MDFPDEDTGINLADTDFERAIDQASTAVAPVSEADHDFYIRVLDACKTGIATIDKQVEDIEGQARRLLDSRKKLLADRQRLATQRNAARISLRYLEDSEARR